MPSIEKKFLVLSVCSENRNIRIDIFFGILLNKAIDGKVFCLNC